jgi:hypothetical protein
VLNKHKLSYGQSGERKHLSVFGTYPAPDPLPLGRSDTMTALEPSPLESSQSDGVLCLLSLPIGLIVLLVDQACDDIRAAVNTYMAPVRPPESL